MKTDELKLRELDAWEVLKKCAEKMKHEGDIISIWLDAGNGGWCIKVAGTTDLESAPTLELAICQFAKQLFEIPQPLTKENK